MSESRLKILRVVIGLNQGGVQQAVLNLFGGLDPNRFEPIACTTETSGAVGGEIEAAGFEVINLGRIRQFWPTVWELQHILRSRQIDIVHGSSYHPSLYARMAAILAATPVRISHEHTLHDKKRFHRLLLNRLLAPTTDGYIAVGQTVAQHVIKWYGYPARKVQVIHNGVDIHRFTPPADRAMAKSRLNLDPTRPVVGMICRLDINKGHRFFFQAIRHLKTQFDAQWLVVGAGRDEAIVRQQADEAGVADSVQFLGMRRDVPELLAAIDIYCLPTLKEGFSNSILEAMSAGCALVVTDFPGNLEAVTDQTNGLITPMGESIQLGQALERLLGDATLRTRLGQAARQTIEQEFSIDVYAQKMAAYYETLWQQRRRGRP